MDTSARLRFLFTRYLQRQCSPDEIEELIILLQKGEADAALTEEMELLWEEARKDKSQPAVDWDKMYSSTIDKGQWADMIIKRAIFLSRSHFYLTAFVFVFIIAAILYWFIYHNSLGRKNEFLKYDTYTGQSYYFNASGNDANEGNKMNPWKTIDKLNKIQLRAGDTVWFEGGQTFKGSILIDSGDTGNERGSIVITSSGSGKATINGGGVTALTVSQAKFITISNLQFTGTGRKTGNTKDGVILTKSSNLKIDRLEIQGFQKSGLLVNSCTDIDVKRVYAHDNGAAGIFATGEGKERDCSNIHISYCTAENNPGDPTNLTNHSGNGILVGLCKNVVIEYCAATNNGWDMPRKGNGPVGIWCYEADSVIIQHCISYKNRTAPGAADGGGFDLDGGVTNSIIQYCLSYENEGSGFGIFQYDGASKWYNNTIRFCISENDGSVSPAHAGVFIWNSSMDTNQFKDCFFYNNTIYNEKGAAISYEPLSANAGFRFYNNIFVAKDSLVIGKETNSIYLGNNWYSLADGFNIGGVKNFTTWVNVNNKEKMDAVTVGLNINPMFTNPGYISVKTPSQLNSFANFQVPAGSVLRSGGLNLLQLFGIVTEGKSFNQNSAPEKGIGACF